MGGTPPRRADRGFFLREGLVAADAEAIREIVVATGRFSAREVDVALSVVHEGLEGGEASGYRFVIAEREAHVVGYACFGPIPGTTGSYDLYWIAVHPSEQGEGVGGRLLQHVERQVTAAKGRRLYVETSCRADYAPTCRFYERSGYRLEARLPDFYAPGDDKAVYVKPLGRDRREGRPVPRDRSAADAAEN